MSTTDISPRRDALQNESDNFALDSNSKVTRRVTDDDAIVVLNAILAATGGTAGTPHFDSSGTVITTPGTEQTLITQTVPASTTRSLIKVNVTTKASGKFEIFANSILIGSGRTGPAAANAKYIWSPAFDVGENLDIDVKFRAVTGSGAQDVEAYLSALDN